MSVTATPPIDEQVDLSLASSRAYCARLTREAARNFYYGLKLLPEPKRSDMFALYAYMRLVDDIADDETGRSAGERKTALEQWRQTTHAALSGSSPVAQAESSLLWPAFTDVARRYDLPAGLFDEAIAGQQQDLAPVTFETFAQLHEYCYRVAGVVGLASIKIWGYEGGVETELMAISRGVAFQMTNILRDLREDLTRGRLYLPREDLAAVGLSEQEVLHLSGDSSKLIELIRLEIARAESFYERSAALESRIDADSRPTLVAMTDIYRGLLRKIADDPHRVLRERVSLSILTKLRIGWRAARAKP